MILKVPCFFLIKAALRHLQFYIALQMGNENAAEYLAKMEETYNSVFQLDPTYTEDKLTLVEFFGGLPPNMGGNTEKAENYAIELEETDLIAGAKAREILMPEDDDYVSLLAGNCKRKSWQCRCKAGIGPGIFV